MPHPRLCDAERVGQVWPALLGVTPTSHTTDDEGGVQGDASAPRDVLPQDDRPALTPRGRRALPTPPTHGGGSGAGPRKPGDDAGAEGRAKPDEWTAMLEHRTGPEIGRKTDYVFSGERRALPAPPIHSDVLSCETGAHGCGDFLPTGGRKKLRRRRQPAGAGKDEVSGAEVARVEVFCLECESRDSIVNGCCQICGHANEGRKVGISRKQGSAAMDDENKSDAEAGPREEGGGGALHKYRVQVELDAVRAMTQFALDKGERLRYIGELKGVIFDVLRADASLHYYQVP